MVDASKIENALLNLAINARDAMPDGGRSTMETANRFLEKDDTAGFADLEPGDYVMIAVSDNGTGRRRDSNRSSLIQHRSRVMTRAIPI